MFDSLIKAIQDSRTTNIYNDRYSDGKLSFLPQRSFTSICVKSLDGLIAYINGLAASDEASVAAIVIKSHSWVQVVGFADEMTGERDTFIEAEAEVPEFAFNSYIERERFQIAIASKFIQSENRDKLIQILGQLSEDTIKQTDDDGISQTVTVKTGIALKGEIVVPSVVRLTPYRTFTEIEQPESEFLIRMRSASSLDCALFEADGGAWKLDARQSIKDYLESNLGTELPILL